MRCVSDSRNRQKFTVYVLYLTDGRMYVGTTAKALSERLNEHRYREGRRFKRSRKVGQICSTRERAEGIERKTAALLRRQGLEVVQG